FLRKSSLWALIIGIDEYKSLKKLSGCIADTNDVVDFLTVRIGVPSDHIKILRNKDATRQAIISSIAAFATDDRIENGDAILIYYAGHGAEANPPQGWAAGGRHLPKIQMICAYDFEPAKSEIEDGQGILDIIMGVHLSRLAKAKGNNVTVILDSCFSGSGTRISNPVPGVLSRGVELPEDYQIMSTIDQELLREIPDEDRQVIISKGFEKTGAASHVLLAACSSNQTAVEHGGRGRFTFALTSLLRSFDLNAMTYQDAISRMDDLPAQTPQCEGVNSSRIIFNGRALDAGRVFYRATSKNGSITLEAGQAQGITKNATFDVLDSANLNALKLGSITAEEPGACSTIMKGSITLTSPAYAVQTSIGDGMDVAIGLPVDNAILPVITHAVQKMEERRPEKRNLRFVDIKTPPEHEIAVHREDKNAVFELTDNVWVKEGRNHLSYRIPLTKPDRLYNVFSYAADFFYHLRRSSKVQEAGRTTNISESISLAVFELKEQYVEEVRDYLLMPKLVQGKSNNLNSAGVIRIDVEEGRKIQYGLELSSSLDEPLYVWAFAFNMSDLSILEIYRPPLAKQPNQTDPSIPKHGSLPIGYGSGGARPLEFVIDNSEDVDVSYIKFFITTEYVDLSRIAQASPFCNHDRSIALGSPSRRLFDTVLVTVVTKKKSV
ncbi:hypothetical protein K435DRAFT_893462, partial [Dendrothele bispora CBS 962.96]